jgi:hypothetical protein
MLNSIVSVVEMPMQKAMGTPSRSRMTKLMTRTSISVIVALFGVD